MRSVVLSVHSVLPTKWWHTTPFYLSSSELNHIDHNSLVLVDGVSQSALCKWTIKQCKIDTRPSSRLWAQLTLSSIGFSCIHDVYPSLERIHFLYNWYLFCLISPYETSNFKTFINHLSGLYCLNDEHHSLNTHFLSASSIANASWWKDANVWGERALATFIISQPRPSSHYCGTSRRSLITSWTTLIQDIRGTLHWFHSRELLCMLSVDKLYFKTFHNERLLPGDGHLIGYAQCATYYHKRKEGDGRARPWVPKKVLSWQTNRRNNFV